MKTLYLPITRLLIMGLSTLLFLSSCRSRMTVNEELILTPSELLEIASDNEKTFVLFWTDWCSGSKFTCKNQFVPLSDTLQKRGLDMEVVLIASDENIPEEKVKEYREMGLRSYYLGSPGSTALGNRLAIKEFIDDTFPEVDFEGTSGFTFAIPVKLLISRDQTLENAQNSETLDRWLSPIGGDVHNES